MDQRKPEDYHYNNPALCLHLICFLQDFIKMRVKPDIKAYLDQGGVSRTLDVRISFDNFQVLAIVHEDVLTCCLYEQVVPSTACC